MIDLSQDLRSTAYAYATLFQDTDEEKQDASEEERKKEKGERREKRSTFQKTEVANKEERLLTSIATKYQEMK